MAWTDRWRRLGNIGNRENLHLAEAMDDPERKAVVREPKFTPSGDDIDINRGVRGLESEVAALRLLNAAGASVPTLYEAEINGGASYCVAEFIEGDTLRDWLQARTPLSDEEERRLKDRLTKAIETAHSVHVYHRDLHAHNIMLRPDGSVAIIDWTLSVIGEEYCEVAQNDNEMVAYHCGRNERRREAERKVRFVGPE